MAITLVLYSIIFYILGNYFSNRYNNADIQNTSESIETCKKLGLEANKSSRVNLKRSYIETQSEQS